MIDEITTHASRFRKALEERGDLIELFEGHKFPKGCCADASVLLGTHLEELGFGSFELVLGYRDSWSHAWLQKDGLIIDITPDQFEEMEKVPLIVATESPWHETFESKATNKADYRIYDARTKDYLGQAYKALLNHMKTGS